MRVEIRDYRGVQRADITLNPVALVAGRNEMGKSCIAEATRAALTGNPIPIPGVLKKNADLLVRDGSEVGHVQVAVDGGSRAVSWPGAGLSAEGKDFFASDYATGYAHVLDLNIKDRSKVLADYIQSEPSGVDLTNACTDAGYNEAATTKVIESINNNGWDHTYKRAREYTATLKGQWQEVTGEKYGAKKGDAHRPDSAKDRDMLELALAEAEQAVVDTAGAVAVSESEIENLKRKVIEATEAGNVTELNDLLNEANASLEVLEQERAVMPEDPVSVPDEPGLGCPECGASLAIEKTGGNGIVLVPYAKPKQPKPLTKKVIDARNQWDEDIRNKRAAVNGLVQRISLATRAANDGQKAAARLEDIEKAPKLDEAAMELAKDAVGDARSALTDHDNRTRAYHLHGDLVKNDKLLLVLAPDGLRKRKLADKLGDFNSQLDTLSESAGWPQVYLDENLECHYDKRPIWAASLSGRWRARTILQVAMARMDGSVAVILDEADMLDTSGRNGLFKMLGGIALKALVCMTFSKRERVPLINQVDLGVSYWIEDGVAEAIR